MKLLITCCPMILRIEQYTEELKDFIVDIPKFTQNMDENHLINIIKDYDCWIAGDDPVTENVINQATNLKVLVKWGIGIDNIDLNAIKKSNLSFFNTPGMFGNEVADVSIGYLLGLTRKLYTINSEVRKGNWFKPSGISLQGKKVGLIGFGDIGRNIADRLLSLKTDIFVYDPGFVQTEGKIKCIYNEDLKIDQRLNMVHIDELKNVLNKSKILILACSANSDNFHMINYQSIDMLDDKSYIINVSRGSLVNENAIVYYLENGKLEGFASDVFEKEPFSKESPLLNYENVILGSHNASNTIEAVDKTSLKSIEILKTALKSENKVETIKLMDIKKYAKASFKKKSTIVFNIKCNDMNRNLYPNLIYTLKWFMKYYPTKNYEYILIEQDTKSNFDLPKDIKIKKLLLYNPSDFNRGWGYNVATKYYIKTDVVVFCDTDIILQFPENIEKSIDMCSKTKKMVSPYNYVAFTTSKERDILMKTNDINKINLVTDHPVSISGGIVTVNREEFLKVGGFEEYCVYGGEDRSLDVLLGDSSQMLEGYGIHLYHPRNPAKEGAGLMLNHLKNVYNCCYDRSLGPCDFIHKNCNHNRNLEKYIELKRKYFGNINLYENKEMEINGFPKELKENKTE